LANGRQRLKNRFKEMFRERQAENAGLIFAKDLIFQESSMNWPDLRQRHAPALARQPQYVWLASQICHN
jgi:hypothetical protein